MQTSTSANIIKIWPWPLTLTSQNLINWCHYGTPSSRNINLRLLIFLQINPLFRIIFMPQIYQNIGSKLSNKIVKYKKIRKKIDID